LLKIGDNDPSNLIEFINCVVEKTGGCGLKVQEKSAMGSSLVFRNCAFKNTAANYQYRGELNKVITPGKVQILWLLVSLGFG